VRRFIDISVPRNIAPQLNDAEGAIVYNVDDLKEVVAANKEERAKAAAEAEVLLQVRVAWEAYVLPGQLLLPAVVPCLTGHQTDCSRVPSMSHLPCLPQEEQLSFEAWRDSLETVPTIKALRGKAETIRSVELEKVLNKLGEGLTNKQKKLIEDMSKGIVNKLLHGPMTALRCDGADPAAVTQTLANMEALERMFELASEAEGPRGRAMAAAAAKEQ
jgi:glutamyl-tRNA reductase